MALAQLTVNLEKFARACVSNSSLRVLPKLCARLGKSCDLIQCCKEWNISYVDRCRKLRLMQQRLAQSSMTPCNGMSRIWQSFLQCMSIPDDPRDYRMEYCSRPGGHYSDAAGMEDDDSQRFESSHDSYALPPMLPQDRGKKTLVLDLDETLVHSSFKPIANYDFIFNVEVENRMTVVYVLKRPFVERFLKNVGPKFEVVIFTASLRKYADPLLDLLDVHNNVRYRLYRESCRHLDGGYVKDLKYLGRELKDIIIVDNSPHSYSLQKKNAVPISTFIDNPNDRELLELIPYLDVVASFNNVREAMSAHRFNASKHH